MITMITLSDLFGNYYASARYSIFHHSIDTASSALESCHCGGYVCYKWWHHLIIKHIWHTITSTNKIFQNPGSKTCSVIPCVDMSPHISLSHNLCDQYLIISQSCIDCQLNYLSDWLLVHRFCNFQFLPITQIGFSCNNGHSFKQKGMWHVCLHTRACKWCARFVQGLPPHTNVLKSQYVTHL